VGRREGSERRGSSQFRTSEEVKNAHPYLLAVHGIPVDSFEPTVVLNIHSASLQIAQPLRQISRKKPLDEVLCDEIDMRREHELVLKDALVDLERVVSEEGREAGEELEEEDAERPPVGGGSVARGGNLMRP
jgi:hypothetical protein